MTTRAGLQASLFVVIAVVLVWMIFGSIEKAVRDRPAPEIVPLRRSDAKVWISLSVCHDDTNGGAFPSLLAALDSTRLWRSLTSFSVLVAVIYDADSQHLDELPNFVSRLQQLDNSVVVRLVPAADRNASDCALAARLQPALAYNNVADEDIVVLADANVMPMRPDALEPILYDYDVWMFGYKSVLDLRRAPSLVAMRADRWRDVLNASKTVDDLKASFGDGLNTEDEDYAGAIVVRALLQHDDCGLRRRRRVWRRAHLAKGDLDVVDDDVVDDDDEEEEKAALRPAAERSSSACFKGDSRWEPCAKSIKNRLPSRGSGCRLWRLDPASDAAADIEAKFAQIVADNSAHRAAG